MMPPLPGGDADERRLLALFRALAPGERATLLAFATFLAQGGAATNPTSAPPESEPEPLPIPRPASESVIAAIKRLSQTYPMLERALLLNDTSALMSGHVLHGRPAEAVIDDLEALFARRHADWRAERAGGGIS